MKYIYVIFIVFFVNSGIFARQNTQLSFDNSLITAGAMLIKKNPQQITQEELNYIKRYSKELLLLMLIHQVPRNKQEEAFFKELQKQYDDLMKFYKKYKDLKKISRTLLAK